MDLFADDVRILSQGGQPVLWHDLTGRHLSLSSEALEDLRHWTPQLAPPHALRGLVNRLRELHLLREQRALDLSEMIPIHSRLPLLLPTIPALWLPDPSVPRQGGYRYVERRLSSQHLWIWRAINGARTVHQVAERAGATLEETLAFLASLTASAVQALQLRDRPASLRDPSLKHLLCPHGRGLRPGHVWGEWGETTLGRWHGEEITDGAHHFDDRETTVAHAFGLAHPGLGGQRYGARLRGVLEERGFPVRGEVLEIGPGDGELAEAWMEAGGEAARYTRLDASPEFLRVQRARVPATRELLGSATALPFADRSVDLVICNEVIADLAAVPWAPDAPAAARNTPVAELEERIRRYRIDPLPGRSFYNLGAWRLIEELARVLAPGGGAFLSEFGTVDEAPEETVHLDHPEVSIHFGHLAAVARAHGLMVQLEPLADLLGFDLRARQLARHSYEALRARFRAEGRALPARAWSPDNLSLPWPVEGLFWNTLDDFGPGPVLTRFYALTLRR